MNEKLFLTANDVAEYVGISRPTAYKIMRQMNNDLKQQGYITVCGKISQAYFLKRMYADDSCTK